MVLDILRITILEHLVNDFQTTGIGVCGYKFGILFLQDRTLLLELLLQGIQSFPFEDHALRTIVVKNGVATRRSRLKLGTLCWVNSAWKRMRATADKPLRAESH